MLGLRPCRCRWVSRRMLTRERCCPSQWCCLVNSDSRDQGSPPLSTTALRLTERVTAPPEPGRIALRQRVGGLGRESNGSREDHALLAPRLRGGAPSRDAPRSRPRGTTDTPASVETGFTDDGRVALDVISRRWRGLTVSGLSTSFWWRADTLVVPRPVSRRGVFSTRPPALPHPRLPAC